MRLDVDDQHRSLYDHNERMQRIVSTLGKEMSEVQYDETIFDLVC